MRDILGDERVLFALSLPFVIALPIQLGVELSSTFWIVVIVWALIFLLGLKMKKLILGSETRAKALESGISNERLFGHILLVSAIPLSALIPLLIGTRVGELQSIRYSGFVGDGVGLDLNIAYGWLRRYRPRQS